MRSCGHCGDSYDVETIHECWVLSRLRAQETLAAPAVTDYASSRPALSDQAWHATRQQEC